MVPGDPAGSARESSCVFPVGAWRSSWAPCRSLADACGAPPAPEPRHQGQERRFSDVPVLGRSRFSGERRTVRLVGPAPWAPMGEVSKPSQEIVALKELVSWLTRRGTAAAARRQGGGWGPRGPMCEDSGGLVRAAPVGAGTTPSVRAGPSSSGSSTPTGRACASRGPGELLKTATATGPYSELQRKMFPAESVSDRN